MTKERIMTLHPAGKMGVNISKEKYDTIRHYILKILKKEKEMSYQDLNDRALEELSPGFEGKVAWYIVTVKLDLEAREIIERVPNTSPHNIRLK